MADEQVTKFYASRLGRVCSVKVLPSLTHVGAVKLWATREEAEKELEYRI